MEINTSNPLNIQLASFAKSLEWKLKKQTEQKHIEYIKIKELCKTKEKPLTITNLYYSGQVVGSTCSLCHPNITSIFQKSFTTVTLKDLLHRKCNKNVKEVTFSHQEVQQFHQCSARSSFTYYFMRAASWLMYHTFSYWYKGFLIHPENIECIRQAQDTGSSILFFVSTPSPDVWTLCSLYFALYYSGLRPPELCAFQNLSWFSRFLFSRLGCLEHGTDPASIITHSVAPFYSAYLEYVIDDMYVVPVSLASDEFVHVNLATPYALSELEIKYSTAELEDENDVDDVRDIDAHIRTDCVLTAPVTALCFVAYVVITSTQDAIEEDVLYQAAQRMRAELIREKMSVNFKGSTESIIQYGLKLLSPYLSKRRKVIRTGEESLVQGARADIVGESKTEKKNEDVQNNLNTEFVRENKTERKNEDVQNNLNTEFVRENKTDLKNEDVQNNLKTEFVRDEETDLKNEDVQNNLKTGFVHENKTKRKNEGHSLKTELGTEYVITNMSGLVHCAMGLVVKRCLVSLVTAVVYSYAGRVRISGGDEVKIEMVESEAINKETIKHKDILSKSLELVKDVERKLKFKLLKYCQNREDEMSKTIGELLDWEILLSTDKALLEEERWCRNIARSLDIETEESELVDKKSYNVESLERSPAARSYINIAMSLNHF